MRLHPREMIVNQAQVAMYEVGETVHRQFPGMTYDQMFRALGEVVRALMDGDGTAPPSDPLARLFFDGLMNACPGTPLTAGEKMAWIASKLGGEARYLIRIERHGNESQSGGIA